MAGSPIFLTNNFFSLQRSEERRDLVGNTFVKLQAPAYGVLGFRGVTHNVSKSGACIFMSCELESGLELEISGKMFGKKEKAAKVIWCSQIQESLFKVGITFLK